MECPNCHNTLHIDENVIKNVTTYQNPVTAYAHCCNTLVSIRPKISYSVAPYKGNATEDDWGIELPKNKKP